MTILVGSLGSPARAIVGDDGTVRPVEASWDLSFWIGADDGWRIPAERAPERDTAAVGGTPVAQTTVRIPGGHAETRVYGLGGGPLAIDVENASGAPFVVALVVSPRDSGRRGVHRIESTGRSIEIEASATLVLPAAPRRWVVATSADELREQVLTASASDGPIGTHRDRRGSLHAALLFPVPHRVTWRSALVLGRAAGSELDLRALPEPLDVVRGWDRALDRGLQVELPDPQEQDLVHLARATLLLAAERAGRQDAELYATLRSWGFDREAERVEAGLSRRSRRRLEHDWFGSAAHDWFGSAAGDDPVGLACARLSLLLRTLLSETDDGVDLLPGMPVEWLGQPVAVRDAPTRHGLVSFALRWHGDRPALIFDVPPGAARLGAPALDPTWERAGGAGEALLAAPEPRLLGLRPSLDALGSPIGEPDSFS